MLSQDDIKEPEEEKTDEIEKVLKSALTLGSVEEEKEEQNEFDSLTSLVGKVKESGRQDKNVVKII